MKIDKFDLAIAIKNSKSFTDVCKYIEYFPNGRHLKEAKEFAMLYNIDYSHFDYGDSKKIIYPRIKKICPQCQKEFIAEKGHPREKQTCSCQCANIYFSDKKHTEQTRANARQKMLKKYENCGMQYIYKDGKNSGLVSKTCEWCSQKFEIPLSKKRKRFCNNSCSMKYRWKYNLLYRTSIMNSLVERIKSGKHKGWASRENPSYPEKFFMKVLKNNNIIYEFEKKCDKYFIDFAITSKMIALEIDGRQHNFLERKMKDAEKDKVLISLGWNIYRIKWRNINSKTGKRYIKQEIEKFLKFYTECSPVNSSSPTLEVGGFMPLQVRVLPFRPFSSHKVVAT